MKYIFVCLLLLSFRVLAHEDTDTNHYVNYLNECSGSKNLNTYTLLEEQTKIFSGDKLNEVCLQNKFKEHHQSHPIKINGKEDGFLKVNTIEFYYENGKKINTLIKDMKLKVNSQIQGDQVRVTGKKIDDLQEVMGELKSKNLEIPLQFVNMKK